MYDSSIHASPGTQVTLRTDTFVISLCYSLLLAMYMDIVVIAKIENWNI
jgi:hypothetical protein